MIAFGCAITDQEAYEACAGPGIELASEPDSVLMPRASTGSLLRNYNILLDEASVLEDLEALVLLHQDSEIVDPEFCSKVREALSNPEVALAGCVGATGVRSIAWWEGSVSWASFIHRYPDDEYGGGDFPAFAWDPEERPSFARTGEVDSIDGFVMVLSPWAVRELRFDESLGKIHGYDFDFCLQVRDAGRKVATADLRVVHHHSLVLINDPDVWIEGHMRVADKWDGRMPGVGQGGGDWKQRARRAEAEAAVLRNQYVAAGLQGEAQARELIDRVDDFERAFEQLMRSPSWRLTAPLRWGKRLLNGGRRGRP